ncbi:MAG: hypothetical protein ACOVP4_07695 [Bacteriovoracaceae bacterium]
MLKNHYDSVLVGKGVLSLLQAVKNSSQNKSVLLIDDSRFQTLSHQSDYISDIELRFITEIGAKFGLNELEDLQDCLSLCPYQLHGGSKSILLGMTPYQNAKEMWRKFSHFLGDDTLKLLLNIEESEFNLWYDSEVLRFTQELKLSFQKARPMKFSFQGPHGILDWINGTKKWLAKSYNGESSLEARLMVHLSSGLFEDKIKKYLDDSDFAYYLLRWISPLYQVDNYRLEMMLERSLVNRGGDIKKTSIQDWQIHENRLFHVLLSTYEGVISMDQTEIYGHLPEDAPFISMNPYQIYQFASVGDLNDEDLTPSHQMLELHLVAEAERLGGERPLRHFVFNQNGIRAFYPYLAMPGTRPEFSRELIFKDASLDFARFHRPLQKINFASSRRQMMDSETNLMKEAFAIHYWPLRTEGGDRQISGVTYQGPFKFQRYGIIGHLLSLL